MFESMELAPICIFSYNRPNHLQRVLDALSKNDLASESVLYIYCDGAKANATKSQCDKVIQNQDFANQFALTAKKQGLFRDIHVICSDKNKGLANSIIGGVTEVINQHGRVIVLEDDLLTSPYFIKYMNAALDFYATRPGVMSVSANRPPLSKMAVPDDYPYDVFASLRSYSTGWATWSDRWNRVDWSMDFLQEFLSHPEQIEAFNRGGDDMTEMLCMQRDGKIDSWAIRFGFAHFREHCVAILPCIPYVDNIGFDGTGIHSGINRTDEYRNDLSMSVPNPRFLDVIYEDSRIINAFYNRFCRKKRPLYQKVINTVVRTIGGNPPFVIKRKIYL